MAAPFYKAIRKSLDNSNLQVALDGNAERRRAGRLKAYGSLPEDLQIMRQRARAVRADVVANLDSYLEAFTARARENGLIVHHAADAAQAVEIVLEIAHQAPRRDRVGLVAKSKTMVGEEIGINHALEAAGFKVVETDLGEYIIQIRGEHPAHIITPAVHLRRSDVAQTFVEKLGLLYNEDIPTMTAAVRGIMRQTFLEADIGISGVNFGVVENGWLCMVTNEGNGRMVTTIPPVHIALMGIERMVPSMDDLALLLALLPRSATGQTLSVYTSLIGKPRQMGEMDGAQERHVVLIDNGRRALRRSHLAEALYCIRCGACLNACPVFREIGGHAYVGIHGQGTTYPGPIGSVISPGLFGQAEFGQLARASSLCGACKEACPVDIDLPKLLLRVRAGQIDPQQEQGKDNAPSWMRLALRIFAWAAVSPWRFAAGQYLVGLFGKLAAPRSDFMHMPAFTGWGYSRDFPRPARQTFQQRFAADKEKYRLDEEAGLPAVLESKPDEDLVSPQTPVRPPADMKALISRFGEELTALSGSFYTCTAAELPKGVYELLRERSIERIQAWEPAYLPVGLLEALQAVGIQVVHAPEADIRAGLTGALAGVAESGSLVMPGSPGRPTSASLLPEIHIAVISAQDIYENLATVLNHRQVREANGIVLITGPSRTADIEMTLTIGVHGPREEHVFCIC
jgi:L-lactate dehydrogenase complex protein LldF